MEISICFPVEIMSLNQEHQGFSSAVESYDSLSAESSLLVIMYSMQPEGV